MDCNFSHFRSYDKVVFKFMIKGSDQQTSNRKSISCVQQMSNTDGFYGQVLTEKAKAAG